MRSWRNESGLPLSSAAWLQDHHLAKLPEREAFAARIAELRPRRIVDLGCATGLWLEVLHRALPVDCEIVGIEADASAIRAASEKARSWNRRVTFIQADAESAELPDADIFLCFNMFGYFKRHELLLRRVKDSLLPNGTMVLRQYDAATMRVGRIDQGARLRLDASLYAGVGTSLQFNHYPMDTALAAVSTAGFERVIVEFDTFHRASPFPEDFHAYFRGSVEWMSKYVADGCRSDLWDWMENALSEPLHYVSETDLVCWLS